MRTTPRGLALGLALSLLARTATAQMGGLDEPPLLPDLARIVERGKLVVAMVEQDLPPILMTSEVGTPSGFDIDLAKALADGLKIDLEVKRTAASPDEVIRQVARQEADLGMSFLSRTAQRAKFVLFSQPYATQHLTLLINRVKALRFRGSCPTVQELVRSAEFSGLLGVRAASANAARVRALNPDAQPREFELEEDLLAAVQAGEVAISLQGEVSARRFLHQKPAARIRLRLCEIGQGPESKVIAVPPGRHDLLLWINTFLEDRRIRFGAQEIVTHKGQWEFR